MADESVAAAARVELAARAAVLKTLMDKIKAEYDRIRAEVDDDVRTAYEKDGTKARVVTVDGMNVATLTLKMSDAAMAIDQAKLLTWCEARYPTEVQTTIVEEKSVRAAFAGQLVGRLVYDVDDDRIVDPETGEVIEWARVVPAGRGTVSMTFEKTGRAAIEHAWRNGRVSLLEVTAHAQTEGENRSQPDRSQTDNDHQHEGGNRSQPDEQLTDNDQDGDSDG